MAKSQAIKTADLDPVDQSLTVAAKDFKDDGFTQKNEPDGKT